jgi:putative SOS response-associated peptidase YedK
MCGRFAFSVPLAVFADAFDQFDFSELHVADVGYGVGRFNIAPTQSVPVVPNDGSYRVRLIRWGLIPHWAKDPAIGTKLINARAESVAEKPSFRDAFRKRRCLMLADGFYEWRTNPGNRIKTPIHIKLKSGRPFAFAGLWETWKPKIKDPDASSEPVHTCTMITTGANALMAQFHHRMPVILNPDQFDLWLSPEPMGPESLLPLMRPYAPEAMVAYPVSTAVNNARHDSPDCIVQVAPAIEQPNLDL